MHRNCTSSPSLLLPLCANHTMPPSVPPAPDPLPALSPACLPSAPPLVFPSLSSHPTRPPIRPPHPFSLSGSISENPSFTPRASLRTPDCPPATLSTPSRLLSCLVLYH
ncbi:hypothetical protein PYCCODRAFT_1270518 [Trametes coccinea BRFM310]|uniref:Uncharacterized protein n=1 Tax=Trametes coccinea (strain BRFM310) TaxID=1353009 RepID=A0A1Y2IV46_TRAC3|nr:hypothetical protein PYCCODRAFT_1270518 [Trametes coccinea BRFM310]